MLIQHLIRIHFFLFVPSFDIANENEANENKEYNSLIEFKLKIKMSM